MFRGVPVSAKYYFLIAAAAYLLVGVILARTVFKAPSMRLRFRDHLLGAVCMPVLFVALLVFSLIEDLWARLLIVLDYEPPEEMRAGPKDPE